jgi:hypothetical protein
LHESRKRNVFKEPNTKEDKENTGRRLVPVREGDQMTSELRGYKYKKRVFLAWVGIVLCLLVVSFTSFLEEWLIVSVVTLILAVYWLAETIYGIGKTALVTTDDEIVMSRSLLLKSTRIPTTVSPKVPL